MKQSKGNRTEDNSKQLWFSSNAKSDLKGTEKGSPMITTHDLRKQNPFDFKCKPDCPQCKEEKQKSKDATPSGTDEPQSSASASSSAYTLQKMDDGVGTHIFAMAILDEENGAICGFEHPNSDFYEFIKFIKNLKEGDKIEIRLIP